MKKILLSLAVLAFSCVSAFAEDVTDELTWDKIVEAGKSTSYQDFSDKSITSSAKYAGNASSGADSYIQLRTTNNNAGIVTTTSGGKLKSVTITFNAKTTDRSIEIYGKNEAYAAATDLYGDAKGTLLKSIAANDDSKTLTVEGDYTFVGLKSANGAIYVDKIEITWETEASTKKNVVVEFAGKTSYDVFVGESFPFPQAYVKDGENIVDDLTVTYAVDNEELAKIEEGTDGTPVVKILAPGKFKITASFAGNDTYGASSAVCSFTAMKKYATLAELSADEATGQTVYITLNEAKITEFYIYKDAKAGIYVNDGTETVLIYCKNVPEDWLVDGKVSGVLICPWKDYNGTKELCPTSWDLLTYDVPTGINAAKVANKATVIFNAAGQLLSAPQKGINIIDGKKIMVK